MSTNKTTNLGLHSWVREDMFRMEEFNDNFNTIDKAVGEHTAALAAKATQTALETLAGQVAAKAEQSALNTEIAARQALGVLD